MNTIIRTTLSLSSSSSPPTTTTRKRSSNYTFRKMIITMITISLSFSSLFDMAILRVPTVLSFSITPSSFPTPTTTTSSHTSRIMNLQKQQQQKLLSLNSNNNDSDSNENPSEITSSSNESNQNEQQEQQPEQVIVVLDPLVKSLTRMDEETMNAPSIRIPIWGELILDRSLFVLIPVASFAIIGFILSIGILLNSGDQFVDALITSDNKNNNEFILNNNNSNGNGCRGLCSSQEEDLQGLKIFMNSLSGK